MYSLVLMSAMTAAPDTAEFNGFFRDLFNRNNCAGCTGGCAGPVRYNGYTGGCSGVSDYASCSGCGGGGTMIFGMRDRVRSWWNADGCCGGCCGGMAYACQGSAAYACFGGAPVSYTPVFNGGLSCQGGPVPFAPAPVFEPYPTIPGGGAPYPSAPSFPPAGPAPTIPYAEPVPAPGSSTANGLRPAGFSGPAGTPVGASGPGARATVVVRLPVDATLYADGAPLKMTGGERKFATPELPAGMEYTYKFTAEYERNGEVVSVTKKVAVRGGGSVAIEFADLTATKPAPMGAPLPAKGDAVAAAPVSNPKPGVVPVVPSVLPGTPDAPKPAADATAAPQAAPQTGRATITVKMPPGATLYVDDKKSPSAEPVRQFTTPALPAGREFAYLLKAEVVRNGRPEQLTQKVTFRAGEQLVIDFTGLGAGR
jgi:uncharacterized protein (TIGR03000 family)